MYHYRYISAHKCFLRGPLLDVENVLRWRFNISWIFQRITNSTSASVSWYCNAWAGLLPGIIFMYWETACILEREVVGAPCCPWSGIYMDTEIWFWKDACRTSMCSYTMLTFAFSLAFICSWRHYFVSFILQLSNFRKTCWQMLTFTGTSMLQKMVPPCRIIDQLVVDVAMESSWVKGSLFGWRLHLLMYIWCFC